MKIVKIVSFICVLALALTLVSSFAFAAAPEAEVEVAEAGENARSPYYCYVKTATNLYAGKATTTDILAPLSVGQQLNIQTFGHDTRWKYVSLTSNSAVKGYVLRTCIVEPG